MSGASDSSRPSGKNLNDNNNTDEDDLLHNCHICMERAAYAVISFCGHLFCWPCIYRWMGTQNFKSYCPVCSSEIGSYTLIPLHGPFDDKYLAESKMVGVPRRHFCPRISQQRDRATRPYHGLVMRDIAVPRTSMFLAGQHFHLPEELERAKPLDPELMPMNAVPLIGFFRFVETSYIPRSISLLITLLVLDMASKANWDALCQ